mgnify:CR=1 FL=1
MEDLQNEAQQKNVDTTIDYIEAIKEIKENSVDKETYLKLKEENKKLKDLVKRVREERIEL